MCLLRSMQAFVHMHGYYERITCDKETVWPSIVIVDSYSKHSYLRVRLLFGGDSRRFQIISSSVVNLICVCKTEVISKLSPESRSLP